jgi:tetratricopeptide (TPR) repeat protein
MSFRQCAWATLAAACLQCVALCLAEDGPVGLISTAEDGTLRRAGSSLPLATLPGEILFPGDVITTGSKSLTVEFCPARALFTLPVQGEFTILAASIRASKGTLASGEPLLSCELPPVVRNGSANLHSYGSTMTRNGAPTPVPAGSIDARIAALPEPKRSEILAALRGVEERLAIRPNDLPALMTRGALYLKYGLEADALREFKNIDANFGAASLRGLIHDLDANQRSAPEPVPEAAKAGKTSALLVGISQYQKLTKQDWLAYADADASSFADFLRSARGGSIPSAQIQLLTNQSATTAAIRNGLYQFLNDAGKDDTIILLIAAHGVVDDKTGEAYIVTNDSDPQDLRSTALLMAEIQKVMYDRLSKVSRAFVYVDVCRAGTIGTIRSNNINRVMEQVLKAPGELLGFMASRSTEYSWEGPNWGGGHGAFSYFILQGLAGEADEAGNKDGVVDVSELLDYVRVKVKESTRDEQHPVEISVTVRNRFELADTGKPGITLLPWSPIQKGPGRGRGLRPQTPAPARTKREIAREQDLADFEDAIDAGRIVPETPGSAFNLLRDRLKPRFNREQYRVAENELRVALENQGQQVLLRYLEGDAVPQTLDSFESGARFFQAARLLTPESSVLESKDLFCRGRALIFEKRYSDSIALLERAARIDPKGAYVFNALGINYLETSRFDLAIAAFRDAIRLAPHWAYPLHNLALAFTETGDYVGAIRSYETAMKVAPGYAYLPYSLGLLYHRLNMRKQAEQYYRQSLTLDPNLASALNALGLLYSTAGKLQSAEKNYREAMAKTSDPTLPRHNLALLLVHQKGRQQQAFELWRKNIAENPGYVPSHLVLAQELNRSGRRDEAIAEYRAIIQLKPDYLGAYVELAHLLLAASKVSDAIEVLQNAVKRLPLNSFLQEELGDAYLAANRREDANAAFAKSLETSTNTATRKRVQRKMSKRTSE